ncbi:MAG: DNA topoisomerase IB, partial [Candidatus Eremiobacteraeota bacterium]|nr:DNA topoisomerase IB [Candidatus Eremiobacteraeota bacterium]
GKSGVRHAIDLHDRRLAKVVQACRDIPGQDLFQYEDDDGKHYAISSQDVNEYIKAIASDDFTAKDFRTWVGTVTCALSLAGMPSFQSESEAKKNVAEAIKLVSQHLGNTPTVCRKCYVHPNVIDAYLEDGPLKPLAKAVLDDFKSPVTDLRPEERAVVRFLERRSKESDSDRTSKQLKRSLRTPQKTKR